MNFRQPPAHGFRAAPETPFFFKLKSPHNAIGGFGWVARYSTATPALAWEAFGEANGTKSLAEIRSRIERYTESATRGAHEIGCIMISNPMFFGDAEWIDQPSDWKPNVVSGAGDELADGEGLRVFEACLARYRARRGPSWWGDAHIESAAGKFGPPQLTRPRLGQAAFRIAVTAAYGGACAVTGEHALPVLEAAHIRPFADDASTHDVPNGLLLRADVHRLFDRGYVTVDRGLRFVVSRRPEEEFENGKADDALEGRKLSVPAHAADRPSIDALRWHNDHVFDKVA